MPHASITSMHGLPPTRACAADDGRASVAPLPAQMEHFTLSFSPESLVGWKPPAQTELAYIHTPTALHNELTDSEYVEFCGKARVSGGFADAWLELTSAESSWLIAPPSTNTAADHAGTTFATASHTSPVPEPCCAVLPPPPPDPPPLAPSPSPPTSSPSEPGDSTAKVCALAVDAINLTLTLTLTPDPHTHPSPPTRWSTHSTPAAIGLSLVSRDSTIAPSSSAPTPRRSTSTPTRLGSVASSTLVHNRGTPTR